MDFLENKEKIFMNNKIRLRYISFFAAVLLFMTEIISSYSYSFAQENMGTDETDYEFSVTTEILSSWGLGIILGSL